MGGFRRRNDAATKDAQYSLRREECALDTRGKYQCNYEGCTNHVVKGGVCCCRHGAKVSKQWQERKHADVPGIKI